MTPLKPKFYRTYGYDTFSRRNKDVEYNQHVEDNYHQNIQLTTEINPAKFLNVKLIF